MNTKALRQKVLDLAVRGRLAPQDPRDEPASALLERIRAQREDGPGGGAGAGRGKRAGPGAKGPVEDAPYEVPEGWEWCRLGDAADIIMGQSPPSEMVSDDPSGVEFHQGKIHFTERNLAQSGQYAAGARKIIDKESVLLCVRAPVGVANIADRKIAIGRGLCAACPLGGISVGFLFHWLTAFQDEFVKQATGTTFLAIPVDVVRNQIVPLPPLAEQERIAAAVEAAFEIIADIERAKADLKAAVAAARAKALSLAMRGALVPQDPNDEPASALLERIRAQRGGGGPIEDAPYEVPEGWEWCRLGTIISVASGDGLTSKQMVSSGTIPVYGANGITGRHNSSNVESKVLVIGRVGSCGKTHIVDPPAWVTDNALIAKIFDKQISLQWLKYMLDFSEIGETSNSTVQPVISGKTIYPMLVPVPPVQEQARIAAALDSAFEYLAAIEAALGE